MSAASETAPLINPGERQPELSPENAAATEREDAKDLASKLNPLAKEFLPSAIAGGLSERKLSASAPEFGARSFMAIGADGSEIEIRLPMHRRVIKDENGNILGSTKFKDRVRRAQKGDCIRRTIYVAEVDKNISEEELAEVFGKCGQVLDCRICSVPHSVLRFAFIEYASEYGARAALSLDGVMLGSHPVKVMPSKTAILPVNPGYLPHTEQEMEMCMRTVYCTNIDKKITDSVLRNFFIAHCGEVSRLKVLGDYANSARIAFIEFCEVEGAIAALNCTGKLIGSLPIRVSPSKTPLRAHNPANEETAEQQWYNSVENVPLRPDAPPYQQCNASAVMTPVRPLVAAHHQPAHKGWSSSSSLQLV